MKAYCIDHFGNVDGVVLQSRADPQPGRREILVRVRATSLNYRDLIVLKGGGRGPSKVGVVPLGDGAGEVVALRDGVTRFAVGDRVIGCFHPRWFGGPIKADYLTDRLGANLDGMLAEYAVVNEEAAVPVPDDLRFEEAATLPCAAVTASVALTRHQRAITAGDTVLTQGTSGVSIFALQFARLLGAQVIATTSSAEKAERLKALGAAAVINYVDTPDYARGNSQTYRRQRGRLRRRDRRTGYAGQFHQSPRRRRTHQPDRIEPVAIRHHARPAPVGRPRYESRLDQRWQPSRFRVDEPGNRIASIAPRH